MRKASVLVTLIALTAVPCFAQAPSPTPIHLAAVLGLAESAPQGLPFPVGEEPLPMLSGPCSPNGSTRTLPTPPGNCCSDGFHLENANYLCVEGMWEVQSYFCGQASCF